MAGNLILKYSTKHLKYTGWNQFSIVGKKSGVNFNKKIRFGIFKEFGLFSVFGFGLGYQKIWSIHLQAENKKSLSWRWNTNNNTTSSSTNLSFQSYQQRILQSFNSFRDIFRPINKKTVALIYLLLSFPLKLVLTPASCEEYICDCGCNNNSSTGIPHIECTCNKTNKSCSNPPQKPICDQCKITEPTKKNKNGLSPMEWCESEELTHKVLVRQACQITVDSVTRILSETVSAYQDYHEKYRCLLESLLDAFEYSRTAHGSQLELIDCKIIMIRSEVEKMKCRIMELESFLCSIQRLADAAAETAFLGHAEYHSIAMSERVQSAASQMKLIKEESLRKERDMIELQSVVIVESGRSLK